MAGTNNPQRRRAALAVLEPILDEDALIEALWLQHDSMRGESISDIIAYIDAVCERYLLDAATRKRLYTSFFGALKQAEDSLPMDPWPLMLQARPAAAAPAPIPAFRAAPPLAMPPAHAPIASPAYMQPAPVPASVSATASTSAPTPPTLSPTQDAARPGTPAQMVFATLVSGLFAGVRQLHAPAMDDLLLDCRTRIEKTRLPSGLRQSARDALVTAELHAWHLDASEEEMSTLVHQFYVSLCECLGPVDADQILMQAVRRAERLPQSASVPPSRFL